LLCRYGSRSPRFNGTEKRLHASGVTLVLSPRPEASKSWTAKTAQHTKVFQLKNSSGSKHLNTLLGKGAMPIGVILYGGNPAIFKFQINLRCIRTRSCSRRTQHCTDEGPGNPRTYQEARQINEVTSLSNNASPANERVLDPMIQ